jgi:hypothetical protein
VHSKALGIWGSTGAIGGTAAWLIGGPITSGLGWEWIDPLGALTDGYQSAFAVAIAVAALGMVAASLLLGRTREPEAVAQAEPAIA